MEGYQHAYPSLVKLHSLSELDQASAYLFPSCSCGIKTRNKDKNKSRDKDKNGDKSKRKSEKESNHNTNEGKGEEEGKKGGCPFCCFSDYCCFSSSSSSSLSSISNSAAKETERIFPESPFLFPGRGRGKTRDERMLRRHKQHVNILAKGNSSAFYSSSCLPLSFFPFLVALLLLHFPSFSFFPFTFLPLPPFRCSFLFSFHYHFNVSSSTFFSLFLSSSLFFFPFFFFNVLFLFLKEHWEERLESTQTNLRAREPILAVRNAIFQIIKETKYRNKGWLKLARLARAENELDSARFVLYQVKEGENGPSAEYRIEKCRLLWEDGMD